MNEHQYSPLGTVEDAAELLRIGRTLAYELAKRGELPGLVKVGRLYRVSLPKLYEHIGLDWSATHPKPETTVPSEAA